jgi:hypothetical protein
MTSHPYVYAAADMIRKYLCQVRGARCNNISDNLFEGKSLLVSEI